MWMDKNVFHLNLCTVVVEVKILLWVSVIDSEVQDIVLQINDATAGDNMAF